MICQKIRSSAGKAEPQCWWYMTLMRNADKAVDIHPLYMHFSYENLPKCSPRVLTTPTLPPEWHPQNPGSINLSRVTQYRRGYLQAHTALPLAVTSLSNLLERQSNSGYSPFRPILTTTSLRGSHTVLVSCHPSDEHCPAHRVYMTTSDTSEDSPPRR